MIYLWFSELLREKCGVIRRKKTKKRGTSKIQKTSIVDQGEHKKIKRTIHSRSSIKINTSPNSDIFQYDYDIRASHSKNHSRKEMPLPSERGF